MDDFGYSLIPDMKKFILILALATTTQAQIDFQKNIWPIFESRCIDCHRKPYEEDGKLKKPKAGLRLDGAWHIMRGSDDGPIVVAERLDASTLYHHISLPSDDDDIMPPKGDPLTQVQIKAISDWILDGARFGQWKGATDGVIEEKPKEHYEPRHVLYFKSLEKGLKPLPETLSAQLSKATTASIRRLHPESPLLDVGFFTTPNEVGNNHLAQLMGLRAHVTKMSLARTGITDQGVALAAQFPRLSYLSLSNTSVTDAGLRKLSGLRNLVSLNLYATQVTDAGINALATCRNLQKIYLSGTQVTNAGAAKLQRRLPKLEIVR